MPNFAYAFERYTTFFGVNQGRYLSAYDHASIMHSRRSAFANGFAPDTIVPWDTIVPKPPYEGMIDIMGQRQNLSDGDRAGVRLLYGPPPGRSETLSVRLDSSDPTGAVLLQDPATQATIGGGGEGPIDVPVLAGSVVQVSYRGTQTADVVWSGDCGPRADRVPGNEPVSVLVVVDRALACYVTASVVTGNPPAPPPPPPPPAPPPPPPPGMHADSAVRGNSSWWSPVYKPDAAACSSHCVANGAAACEWYVNGDCYVEFT